MGDLEQTRIIWEIIREILTSLSAIVVAFAAITGLSTWKRQMVGKDYFDLAKRVLCAVYELRSAIDYVRWPVHSSDEVTLAKETILNRDCTTREGLTEYEIQEALYSLRWKKITTASTGLISTLKEAEALWGKDIINITNPLLSSINNLRSSIDKYLINIKHPRSYPEDEITIFMDVVRSKLWTLSEDEYNKQLEETIKNIDDYLRPQFITPKH